MALLMEQNPHSRARGSTPNTTHSPREPLPYMGTHSNTPNFRVYKGIPGRGMLFVSDIPSSPSVEVREALIGFHIGDIATPGLSALQRI